MPERGPNTGPQREPNTEDALPVPLEQDRERIIGILYRHVADDVLTLEEFERRVYDAHRAKSLDVLRTLVSDLPQIENISATSTASPARRQIHQLAHRRESQVMIAIMGGTARKGLWVPARRTTVIAMMGGAELDFREVDLEPGVTEVTIIALMGGAEVIVPPGLAIDCNGIGIMGGFDHHAATTTCAAAPDAPLLRIKGVALMGGVEITVRLPGESAGDARRRHREELRAARKERLRLQKEQRSGGGY